MNDFKIKYSEHFVPKETKQYQSDRCFEIFIILMQNACDEEVSFTRIEPIKNKDTDSLCYNRQDFFVSYYNVALSKREYRGGHFGAQIRHRKIVNDPNL